MLENLPNFYFNYPDMLILFLTFTCLLVRGFLVELYLSILGISPRILSEFFAMLNKKCPSYDSVIMTKIYDRLPLLAPVLANLFNQIVETGVYPAA